MDAKITKQRLSHLLSYDWLKIIATAVGAILIWSLIFTMSATRILPSQQFGVFNYFGSSVTTRFNEYANLSDKFSHEVFQMIAGDMAAGGEEFGYQVVEARLAAHEVDVVFTADTEGANYQYRKEQNGEIFTATYLEEFLYRYYQRVYRLDGKDGYLKRMENYLNSYYHGDYLNGALDEEKIENDFRAFVKNSKDKRYKNEKSVLLGVQGELDRIKNYRASLIDFYSYLDAGYIRLEETSLFLNYGGELTEMKGAFSVNLCPNEKMEDLKKDVYYRVKDEESGQTKTTALNMNLVFISDPDSRASFEFENLTFVNHLVKAYCSDLK